MNPIKVAEIAALLSMIALGSTLVYSSYALLTSLETFMMARLKLRDESIVIEGFRFENKGFYPISMKIEIKLYRNGSPAIIVYRGYTRLNPGEAIEKLALECEDGLRYISYTGGFYRDNLRMESEFSIQPLVTVRVEGPIGCET